MLSVVIEAFKKSVMFLCTPFTNGCLVYYTVTGLYITLHSSSARLDGIHPTGADSPDWDLGCGIRLISTVSVIKRLSLYEFALWGQDLVSVVRIRESPYYRGFFFYSKYMRILSGHWKLSVIERCPY